MFGVYCWKLQFVLYLNIGTDELDRNKNMFVRFVRNMRFSTFYLITSEGEHFRNVQLVIFQFRFSSNVLFDWLICNTDVFFYTCLFLKGAAHQTRCRTPKTHFCPCNSDGVMLKRMKSKSDSISIYNGKVQLECSICYSLVVIQVALTN